MEAIRRYELIRPILQGEKTVEAVHHETNVPLSTLYYYLQRFREGNEQIESLADKSHAVHSHPHWFTEAEKDEVVWYKLKNPEKSARQIAKDLTTLGILPINYHSVADILNQRRLTAIFFWTKRGS